jgi:hypothetical protein
MMDTEWPWEKREREQREKFKHDRDRKYEELKHELNEVEKLEKEELKLLRRAQSATLVILNDRGVIIMPANLVVGQTAQAVYQEWSLPAGTGVKLPSAGPVAFATSDGAIATVDPVSGLVTAVAAGTVTITGSDATNGLNASDTATVTGIAAQSATLVITPNAAPTPGPTPVSASK